ncbi:MAG: aminotransferase class III-fold pyridoxal phosphate-dependent enzyme [Novosphingobium sp.]
MAKRLAGLVPNHEYDGAAFFRADAPPEVIAAQRESGFARLSASFKQREKTLALTAETRVHLADLQFTSRYRVPYPFSRVVREALPVGAFVASSDGPVLHDLDGNALLDLTGSYGVNLFGHEFYKQTIAEGAAAAGELGPVLGQYHPLLADTVARLAALSGMDEVSFHMSGTEAVMQAVRLAQYHTGRARMVRFAGAYHGWWGDVQPGIGNPVPADRTLTLAEMSERTLAVLARRRDIACVLVNPLQALHPNAPAPADSHLVDSARAAVLDQAAYGEWLRALAETCREAGIVLILDEVFTGFRLAKRGAGEYFGVRPDLVTYGKTLGGGLPIGVLCGRAELMRRFNEQRPVDICFARGTFNAHPYVIAAANAFLRRLDSPEIEALYDGMDERWAERARTLNTSLQDAGLPVRVAALTTIWTVTYTRPSRYNWMLQYYLRNEGLALSWVGTGRIIFSLDYDDARFAEVVARFVRAARTMQEDGWWWNSGESNRDIRRSVMRAALRTRLGRN